MNDPQKLCRYQESSSSQINQEIQTWRMIHIVSMLKIICFQPEGEMIGTCNVSPKHWDKISIQIYLTNRIIIREDTHMIHNNSQGTKCSPHLTWNLSRISSLATSKHICIGRSAGRHRGCTNTPCFKPGSTIIGIPNIETAYYWRSDDVTKRKMSEHNMK